MTKAKYRHALPQLGDTTLLTDGGMETTFIFHDGMELPHFASFDLLKHSAGRAKLEEYFQRYIEIAHRQGVGFVLEAPTWRANADWGARLGYDTAGLDAANRDAIDMLIEIRERFERDAPFVISGCIGPRGDGYDPSDILTADEAEAYHAAQIATFDDAGVDMVSAITMTQIGEAQGIARAAARRQVPCVIAFTVETDGRLPSGDNLATAIGTIDADPDCAPAYFMINCAHPDHFREAVSTGEGWISRIRGVRSNASRMSHAELDQAEELDDGDPQEFGQDHASLTALLPNLRVFGGCCGTDHRHVASLAQCCMLRATAA